MAISNVKFKVEIGSWLQCITTYTRNTYTQHIFKLSNEKPSWMPTRHQSFQCIMGGLCEISQIRSFQFDCQQARDRPILMSSKWLRVVARTSAAHISFFKYCVCHSKIDCTNDRTTAAGVSVDSEDSDWNCPIYVCILNVLILATRLQPLSCFSPLRWIILWKCRPSH